MMIATNFINVLPFQNEVATAGSSIRGTTEKLSISLPCLVRCYEKGSGRLIAQTNSTKDGDYAFFGLNSAFSFFIVAHDPTSQYNAVIQDNVVPK